MLKKHNICEVQSREMDQPKDLQGKGKWKIRQHIIAKRRESFPVIRMQGLAKEGRNLISLISFKGQTRNSAPVRFGFRPKNKFVKSIRDSARVAKISQSWLSDKFVPRGVDENTF